MWKILQPPAYKPEMEADKVDAKYKRMRLQVFLGIFIGYAGFYIVRKNFSMAIPELALLGFDQSELSIVLAMNAVAYALSKFLMGSVSDRSNARVFLPLELVARVKSQLRRYTKLGTMTPETVSNVYRTGGLEINDDMKQVTVDGRIVEKLTPIQYNILLFLTKNKGRVFSIEQIYENIWNEDAINADNTVAVHIRHIREKIEINPKEPRYLKVVWGIGYKMEDIKVE